MASRIVANSVTLSDLRVYSYTVSLFRCDFSYCCMWGSWQDFNWLAVPVR